MSRNTPASNAHKLKAAVEHAQRESYLTTLFPFCHYEQQGNSLVVSMPKDIAAFEEVWRVIQQEAERLHLTVLRQGKWPTAKELDLLFGQVTWLWNKWIPVGFVTLLVGEPGSGKSVALQLVVAHAALSPDCRLVLVDGKRV